MYHLAHLIFYFIDYQPYTKAHVPNPHLKAGVWHALFYIILYINTLEIQLCQI